MRAAICHSDIALFDGPWGGDLPAVYGHEPAGVVNTVGPGVAGITPGARVVVEFSISPDWLARSEHRETRLD